MTQTYSVTGMTCEGCAATVQKALASVESISSVKVDLEKDIAEVTMTGHVPVEKLQKALKPYPSYRLTDGDHPATQVMPTRFWNNPGVWSRASLNTLNCLIGCSIGDFAMVMYLQRYFPQTSMTLQMVLATLAGLVTSVMMETILLHLREKFNWSLAFQTAVSMSFLSMVAMELVMNTTDFMITGGKAAFGNPMYWTAMIVAVIAGFLAPLPYNYYRLKKYNQACH